MPLNLLLTFGVLIRAADSGAAPFWHIPTRLLVFLVLTIASHAALKRVVRSAEFRDLVPEHLRICLYLASLAVIWITFAGIAAILVAAR
jgi:hypothetical protein